MREHGGPARRAIPMPTDKPPEFFMDWLFKRIEPDPNSGCWLWTGKASKEGYGIMNRDGFSDIKAHRLSYWLYKGEIPHGMVIDHKCRTPACVNPDHLEPVTQAENVMRGNSLPARNKMKTHCLRGHEFLEENRKADGARGCLTCSRYRRRRASGWVDLDLKEARLLLALCGGGGAIRPSDLTGNDALALLERLRAYVKCDGSSADTDT